MLFCLLRNANGKTSLTRGLSIQFNQIQVFIPHWILLLLSASLKINFTTIKMLTLNPNDILRCKSFLLFAKHVLLEVEKTSKKA